MPNVNITRDLNCHIFHSDIPNLQDCPYLYNEDVKRTGTTCERNKSFEPWAVYHGSI